MPCNGYRTVLLATDGSTHRLVSDSRSIGEALRRAVLRVENRGLLVAAVLLCVEV